MKQVILDTDFILSCLTWKVDIKSELRRILDCNFEICILDKTIDELKNKKGEALALELIKNFTVLTTARDKPVDDLIGNFPEAIVATQDKELKEKLKKRKIPVITIRQKKYLILQ